MTTQQIIGITIAVYLVFMLVIGLLSRKGARTITDFTVGGRNAGAWVSALSYGTAYFSAVMFIGYAGTTGWKYGIWAVLPGIGNAIIGSLLAWLVLARRTREVTRRLEIKSMPQLFEKRFASVGMKYFAVAVIFVFLLPYSASVYNGLTSVCKVLLDIPEFWCKVIIAAVSVLLVTLGGYLATLKADFVQGLIMLGGILVLIVAVMRCDQVGGIQTGLSAIVEETKALNLKAQDHMALWATVLMTSFGTWGLPQMIHKYYGIRDDHEVRRGTIISTVFALVVAGGGYFIGSLSHLFYTSETYAAEVGAADYLVPNMLLKADLSSVLLGVILVLLIAASVSTLSSVTITASTTLTMDMIKARIRPNMSEKRAALAGKVVCVVFIGLSYLIANNFFIPGVTSTPILDMMSYSWGVISGSFLAPYALMLYWKGLNRAGAWAGVVSGFAVAMPPLIAKLFFPTAEIPVLGNLAACGPHFACFAMLLSLVLCVVVSHIARAAGWKSGAANEAFYAQKVQETEQTPAPVATV